MLGTLFAALLVIFAAVVAGRAVMLLCGWKRPEWAAGAVGFGALVVVAPFAIRLPGRGMTAAVILAVAVVACAWITRRAVPDRRAGRDSANRPRSQHSVALVVLVATVAIACLPFVFNERTGVLGEGIYTNDQAAQLYWADWLADGFGPQPGAVSVGYPVGPQALAAVVSEGTGIELLDAFNGLLLAIPALTALAALSLLDSLAPGRRAVAAVLSGLPYLGASFLAQSGFKETAMAMFLIAMVVTLHAAFRRRDLDGESPPAPALAGVLALLAVASVFTFSVPGGVWFAIAIPVWAILAWAWPPSFRDERDWGIGSLVRAASQRRAWLGAAAVGLVAVGVLALGPAGNFIEKIDEVQGSSGRLSSPVFPGEVLGVWPEGDFRVVRGEVDGSLLATGFAALCALGAVVALWRRREWALLAGLAAAAFVYALARPFAEIHVEAKALAVMAPLTMLVTVRWLLQGGTGRLAVARQVVGALFASLAAVSTFLALRAAPVGFNERGEDLAALASEIQGEKVVFLGVDRFAGYWLRGTLAESPGGYVPQDVDARPEKTWQQGLAMDFDTLSPSKLDRYDYAITTAAGYASTPPSRFREIAREGDYVLWERTGETGSTRVLDEGGDPGKIFDCALGGADGSSALTLAEPPTVEQEEWSPGFSASAPASFRASLPLDSGLHLVSLQYHSQVPLTVSANGEEVGRVPPSLEGLYLTGAGRGAFWPAGEFAAAGGETTIEIAAAPPSGLQDALGVERKVWIGKLALTRSEEPELVPGREACDRYVDHFLTEKPDQ